MLERQGLVDTRPRRGTFVTRISSRDAQELCQARALLEAFALTVGRTHLDAAVLTRLQSQVDAMRRCGLPRDLPHLIECDLAFHQAIIELCAMPRLVELWTTLNGRIGAIILRSVEEQELRVDDVVALHAELLAALRQDDVAAMQQAVVHHYVRTEAELAALPEYTGQVAGAAAVFAHRPDRASALSIAV
jgi:DNA-binding GntR family transcriptional regulator